MPGIAWSEKFCVGVTEIDRQHQRLLELFNGLEEALARGGGSRVAAHLVSELDSYARYHFSTEQNLMRARACPELTPHVEVHDDFVAKVSALQQMMDTEGRSPTALESSRFLRAWILRHIVVADRLVWAVARRDGRLASS